MSSAIPPEGTGPLRLHDARRGQLVPFVAGRTVRLYVCGITPYDSAHLGHAFTYTVFDVLVRVLEDRGHDVVHCRNVTDVDDDMVRVAAERAVSIPELTRTEVAVFRRQLDLLGVREADLTPYASETIPAIVTAVQGLLDRGVAYDLGDGRVYLDTTLAQPAFGTRFEDRDEPARRERFASSAGDPEAPGKRHPLDVLLWQPEDAGDARWPDAPAWDSPWGVGRPGWHIECSVMAMEHLGATIDIHGGGRDLDFPHHEAEILQSELLTGQAPFSRFWMHTAMVEHEGEKMSKSLGNLVYIDDLVATHPAGAVRRYLLEHHYRTAWSFDADMLERSAAGWKGWAAAAAAGGDDPALTAEAEAALADDLDTPTAIAVADRAAGAGAGATVARVATLLGIPLT